MENKRATRHKKRAKWNKERARNVATTLLPKLYATKENKKTIYTYILTFTLQCDHTQAYTVYKKREVNGNGNGNGNNINHDEDNVKSKN